MKTSLFNVTNLIDNNPGCRATISGLKSVIKYDLIYEVPLGFGYDVFQSKMFSFKNFKSSYHSLLKKEVLQKCIRNTDLWIINGEGTIHSKSIGEKVLLTIAKIGQKNRKKVFIVNASFHDLGYENLKILRYCNIFTREVESHNYLNSNGIRSKLVLDCAFLSKFNKVSKTQNQCLYTPGVLFSHGKKKQTYSTEELLMKHFQAIKAKYDTPYFLQIENAENNLVELWKNEGGKVINSARYSVAGLIEEISRFELLVSGRYHILVFAIMTKTQAIPLNSNTRKIQGLYKYFNSDIDNKIQNVFSDDLNLKEPIKIETSLDRIREEIRLAYLNL